MPTPSFRGASQVASGSTGSFTCPKPAGTASGDILVAFHSADGGSLSNMGTPTGGSTWTLLASQSRVDSAGAGSKAWWKVAGDTEPASYGFTQGASADGSVSIIAVKDGLPVTPVVASSGTSGSTTSVSTPSTTPTGSDDFEIRCAASQAGGISGLTWTPPATGGGFTERTDIQSGVYSSTSTATRTLTSSGATGAHVFTPSSAIWAHGYTVNIAARAGFTGWGMPI